MFAVWYKIYQINMIENKCTYKMTVKTVNLSHWFNIYNINTQLYLLYQYPTF